MIISVNEGMNTDLLRLATAETRMILAKLFWQFDYEVMPESEGWQSTQKGTVAWHRTPLMSKFKRRQM
jgi:hypothetical protein